MKINDIALLHSSQPLNRETFMRLNYTKGDLGGAVGRVYGWGLKGAGKQFFRILKKDYLISSHLDDDNFWDLHAGDVRIFTPQECLRYFHANKVKDYGVCHGGPSYHCSVSLM